jgi:hypothetical protein
VASTNAENDISLIASFRVLGTRTDLVIAGLAVLLGCPRHAREARLDRGGNHRPRANRPTLRISADYLESNALGTTEITGDRSWTLYRPA